MRRMKAAFSGSSRTATGSATKSSAPQWSPSGRPLRPPRRMVNRTAAALLLAVVATLAIAVPATTQTQTLAITRATVVDVAGGRLMPDSTVTIAGGTITAVTPNGRPPRGAKIVDGQGKFLIPGMWDMHAHMEASGESALQLSVAHGVTGLRDMGSDVDLI